MLGCLTKFLVPDQILALFSLNSFHNQKKSYESCKEIEFAGIVSVVFHGLQRQ
jgi:hypothetical protein